MKIGNHEFKNKVFLAPLAGVTDLSYRTVCKRNGCEFVYTEMISAKGVFYNDDKSLKLANFTEIEKPIGIQIFGSDPKILAYAANRFNQFECLLIDINMGCPVQKVVRSNEGSALMRNPKLIEAILIEVIKASIKPVTIKIRAGWDENEINAVEIAKIAEQCGVAAITVHGRTRKQFYSGNADWDIIKKVKESVSIPVIGNGDVVDPLSAKAIFQHTNCDAIMIGRGALGNPWIFNSISEYFNSGLIQEKPSFDIVKNTILEHFELLIEHKGEYSAIREMRKHIAWYIKGLQNNCKFKQEVFKIEAKDELIELINTYFEALKNEL